MTILLIVAWVHGCIGIYFWLRLKPFFIRAAPYLLAAAVLIPTLALLGIYQGGRSVAADSEDGEWRPHNYTQREVGTFAQANTLDRITGGLTMGYFGLLGLVLLGRGVRGWRERRGGMIALSYGNGKTVRVPKGLSVLEASLRHNVPHASVCGGRARCSAVVGRIRFPIGGWFVGAEGGRPDRLPLIGPVDAATITPAGTLGAASPASDLGPVARLDRLRGLGPVAGLGGLAGLGRLGGLAGLGRSAGLGRPGGLGRLGRSRRSPWSWSGWRSRRLASSWRS